MRQRTSEWKVRIAHWMETLKQDMYLPLGRIDVEDFTTMDYLTPDEAAARAWAQELGAQAASLDEILSDKTIEGVLVCCATNEHDDIIVRACDSGKAVFTEKVLSLTNEGAVIYWHVKRKEVNL